MSASKPKCWIVVYQTRHGLTVKPLFSRHRPHDWVPGLEDRTPNTGMQLHGPFDLDGTAVKALEGRVDEVKAKPPQCWVVIYEHRHGVDAWPVFQPRCPTEREIISQLTDWEPERGETIEFRGPYGAQELKAAIEAAWAEGWDSLEGAVLRHLGIKDLECHGVEEVIRDLVRRCPGFKEWRRRYKEGSMEQREARRARRKK